VEQQALLRLVDALRSAGFRAGASEAVSAARLLMQLRKMPGAPQDVHGLCPWLRPIFCSSPEEQTRFDTVYKAWADAFDAARRPPPPPPPPPRAEARVKTQWSKVVDALPTLFALLVAGGIAWNVITSKPPVRPAPAPASAPVVAQPAPQPYFQPAPVAAAASEPAVEGLFPALRESRTVRPTVLWALLGLPLAVLVLGGGVPGMQLFQGRRRSVEQVFLDVRALGRQAREVLPKLAAGVAGRLERHLRGATDELAPRRPRLDERRTVEATVARPGRIGLRWRPAPVRPSYLLLIDAEDEDDPRGRLFALWAERLQREGLDVDIRLFAPQAGSDAPVCWPSEHRRAGRVGVPLDRLPAPPEGQRLVVVSDAAAWVHTQDDGKVEWREWFARARLHRWPQRAFFTAVELRDWGAAEDAMEAREHGADPGFIVLPLDENALDAWSKLLVRGSFPRFSIDEPQSYPRLLTDPSFDAYQEPEPGPAGAERLGRLIAQLKLYLGDSGFRWLAALAVPPLVRWELTLLLGRALFQHREARIGEDWQNILARSYRRLARLPWLRNGGRDEQGQRLAPRLPDWLRLRLLDELPATAQAEIREVVDGLLSQMRPHAAGTLPLGFEAPPRPGRTAEGAAGDSGDGDALYLGYLSGLTPRQLALRMPENWSHWLPERESPPGFWNGVRERVGAGRARLQATLARLSFRQGLPWAGRGRGSLRLAVLGWAAAVAVLALLALLPVVDTPPWLAWASRTDTRPVEVPGGESAWRVALSPDGTRGLRVDRDGRITVWRTADGSVLQRLEAKGPLLRAQFGDDGAIVACGANSVWRWDGATQRPSSFIVDPPLGESGTDCEMSTAGDVVVRHRQDDRQAYVWFRAADSPTGRGTVFRDVEWASLSGNGRWLLLRQGAAKDMPPRVQLVEVRSGRVFRTSAPSRGGVEDTLVAWTGDTLTWIDRDADGGPRLVRAPLPAAEPRSVMPLQAATEAQRRPYSLSLSGDARYAAIGYSNGDLETWHLPSRQLVQRVHTNTAPLDVLLSADASVLVSRRGALAADATAPPDVWRAWQAPVFRQASADLVTLSGDGRRAAFATRDGRITVRDTASGRADALQEREPAEVLALSPDGQRLAVHGNRQLTVWPGLPRNTAWRTTTDTRVVALGFTDDDRLRAVTEPGQLLEWRRTDNPPAAPVVTRLAGDLPVLRAHLHRGGALAYFDTSGRLTLQAPRGPVRAAGAYPLPIGAYSTFSDGGGTFWFSAASRVIGLDTATGAAVLDLVLPGESQLGDLDADDAQGLVAFVDSATVLRVMDVRRRAMLERPPHGRDGVYAARWLPGRRLLVADTQGRARIWDTARGEPDPALAPFTLFGDTRSLRISADRDKLLAQVWLVKPTFTIAAPQAKAAAQTAAQAAAQTAAQTAAQAPPAGAYAGAWSLTAGVWSLPAPAVKRTVSWLDGRGFIHPLFGSLIALLLGVGLFVAAERRARLRRATLAEVRRAAAPATRVGPVQVTS
jgi:uncharacterized protein with von Willebrand factor type A (vWA) domain